MTTAGKLEIINTLLGGQPIFDENGNPTGEMTPSLITKEQALELLNMPIHKELEFEDVP